MFPITAVQFGMNRYLEQLYLDHTGDTKTGTAAKIGVAMGAGCTSAFFGCPAEFVMIQQQRHGRSLGAEFKHIITEKGILTTYKGLVSINTPIQYQQQTSLHCPSSLNIKFLLYYLQSATFCRESLYAAGYLGVMPLLRDKLEEIPSVQSIPGGPLVVSGIAAGLLATVTTQPADTIKTRMQAFPDRTANPEYRSMVSTAQHIVRTEGAGTLFAGLVPRAARIVCAVFILTGTRNTAIEFLEERKSRLDAAGVSPTV